MLYEVITISERFIGFFAISVPMFIAIVLIPNAFGGGDIKLLAVCGFFLGWKYVLLGTFFAILIEGVYVIIIV